MVVNLRGQRALGQRYSFAGNMESFEKQLRVKDLRDNYGSCNNSVTIYKIGRHTENEVKGHDSLSLYVGMVTSYSEFGGRPQPVLKFRGSHKIRFSNFWKNVLAGKLLRQEEGCNRLAFLKQS